MSDFLALISQQLTVDAVLLVLVAWVIFAILTDKLVTRKRLEEKQAEADKWHDAYDTLDKAHAQTVKQNSLLMEQSGLFLHVVRALGTGTLQEQDLRFIQTKERPEREDRT